MTDRDRVLLEHARLAAERAFLTKPAATRYGAAVRTTSGRIFVSGQYSSFNHITNIHAEMGAVLVATMAGAADVTDLALVSTSALGTPARPCGVCREFLAEHARRTGRDFRVLLGSWDGSVREEWRVSALLPGPWESAGKGEFELRPAIPHPPRAGEPLEFGDQVETGGDLVSLVWHPSWQEGRVLLKLKYAGGSKLPHSFTHYADYQRELGALGVETRLPWGDLARDWIYL